MTSGVVKPQVAQAPLGIVNTTLRNSLIIRVCIGIMQSHRIVQNKVKNNIDLSFLFMYITCVLRAFGGVSERFQRVLASLYSSSKFYMERVHIGPIFFLQAWLIRHYTTEKLRKNSIIMRSRETSPTSNPQFWVVLAKQKRKRFARKRKQKESLFMKASSFRNVNHKTIKNL